jgi:hypothetical protein
VVDELIDMVGSEHQLTLAYSSEENAIVERANKEVMRQLRAILLDKRVVGEWTIYSPLLLVQRIMNASVHSAQQMSPAQIIFGNSITLDRGSFESRKFARSTRSRSRYQSGRKICKIKKLILTLAKAAQESTDDFHIGKASAKRTEFPINSYVLVKYRDRPPTKFHSNWNATLRVVSFSNCEGGTTRIYGRNGAKSLEREKQR